MLNDPYFVEDTGCVKINFLRQISYKTYRITSYYILSYSCECVSHFLSHDNIKLISATTMGIVHSNFWDARTNDVLLQNAIIIAEYTVTEQ